ncbi:MAG: hypothetical protein Q9204_005834 [Flavoplaca sp. TL-2023a]
MSFHFLDLPAEIRAHVFNYLLPNVPIIDCDTAWTPNEETHIGFEYHYTYENPLWISDQGLCYSYRRQTGPQALESLLRTESRANTHFKELTVDFLNHGKIYSDREDDGYETESETEEYIPSLWESCHDAPENLPPEIADAAWGHQNFEYAAWYFGWGLTFAYLMSSIMMLSGVATIQIPNFCTGNPRYEMLKG